VIFEIHSRECFGVWLFWDFTFLRLDWLKYAFVLLQREIFPLKFEAMFLILCIHNPAINSQLCWYYNAAGITSNLKLPGAQILQAILMNLFERSNISTTFIISAILFISTLFLQHLFLFIFLWNSIAKMYVMV